MERTFLYSPNFEASTVLPTIQKTVHYLATVT